MDIQIDLSGRIETLNSASAFAFANGKSRTILIPARVKRNVSRRLASRGVKSKMISVRMFAGATYLLVHPLLVEIKTIVIDREFEGWENEIRSLLLRLIRQAGHEIRSDAIQFRSVGKHARCLT